jgi:hypothetical protein
MAFHQQPLRIVRHPITNKLCSLNCWYYSVVYNKSFPIDDFHSFSIVKSISPSFYIMPSFSHISSCIPTKSNLNLANAVATVISEPCLYWLLTFLVQRQLNPLHNKASFYSEELAPRPTPKLEDHSFSAVCDCLFNIFTATLHIGGHSSICNLRMRLAMVTEIYRFENLKSDKWQNYLCQ